MPSTRAKGHASVAITITVALVWSLSACARTPRQAVLVFAAASLEEAVSEAAAAYTRRSGTEVEVNSAGSNVLAQQILAGAPADVFVSADARWIDDLIARGSLEADSRRELLTNHLVVVANRGSGFALDDLSQLGALPFRYLSIADPDAVPAGRYARSLLEQTPGASGTAWDEVAARVAPAPDVRSALAMVAAEPEAVGIVYRSDVTQHGGGGAGGGDGREQEDSGAVRVLLEIAGELDPPIRYVAALVRRSPAPAADSSALLEFLAGPEASAIFERHGFLPLPAAAP